MVFQRHTDGGGHQFGADAQQYSVESGRQLPGGGDERRRFGDERGGDLDGLCSGGDRNPTFKPDDDAGPERRFLRRA